MSSQLVEVYSSDIRRGFAMIACPYCHLGMVLQLPPIADVLMHWEGASCKLGMQNLPPQEHKLFDTLHANRPAAVPNAVLVEQLGISLSALRLYMYRLRRRIKATGWRIEGRGRTYRLYEPGE